MPTRTMESRHQIGLDSYDRLFPNQDTMTQGGFGSLIALPLQRGPRNEGNSVFLRRDFCPIPDQWSFLVRRKDSPLREFHEVVREAERTGNLIGVRLSACEEEESDPWLMPPSQKKKPEVIAGPLPDRVAVTLGNLVYVPKDGLPSAMLNQLLRLAAFQNPEFIAHRPCGYPLLANRGSSTVRRSFRVIWDCRADARVKSWACSNLMAVRLNWPTSVFPGPLWIFVFTASCDPIKKRRRQNFSS